MSDVENFLTQQIDLLIISPNEAAPLTAVVKKAYDQKIPVIVLDRVRENEATLRKHTYDEIVNISLWETLTRSLNTSFITLLPILSLNMPIEIALALVVTIPAVAALRAVSKGQIAGARE